MIKRKQTDRGEHYTLPCRKPNGELVFGPLVSKAKAYAAIRILVESHPGYKYGWPIPESEIPEGAIIPEGGGVVGL